MAATASALNRGSLGRRLKAASCPDSLNNLRPEDHAPICAVRGSAQETEVVPGTKAEAPSFSYGSPFMYLIEPCISFLGLLQQTATDLVA